MRRRELRPWNVRPGMVVEVGAFPFENGVAPTKLVTVGGTGIGRHFQTGEHYWQLADAQGSTLGIWFRDQRVTVVG